MPLSEELQNLTTPFQAFKAIDDGLIDNTNTDALALLKDFSFTAKDYHPENFGRRLNLKAAISLKFGEFTGMDTNGDSAVIFNIHGAEHDNQIIDEYKYVKQIVKDLNSLSL